MTYDVCFTIALNSSSVDPHQLVQQRQPQQQQQQQSQPLRDSRSMSLGGMGGLGGLDRLGGLGSMGGLGGMAGMAGLGGLGAIGGPEGDGESGSAVEVDPTQVEEIRGLVAQNLTLIRPLVAQIKEQEPDQAADLTEDPESVLRFFNRGANDNTPLGGRSVPVTVNVPAPATAPAAAQPANLGSGFTLAEEASINRVGFSFHSNNSGI
jgi:XPC-binding domain